MHFYYWMDKPPPLLTLLEFLHKDVGEEYQHPSWEQPDGTLVNCDDVLQGVDPLLHGVGVDVVINGGPDAPHHPHGIHQGFHGGGDHWELHLQLDAGCRRCLVAPQHCIQRKGGETASRGNAQIPKLQPQIK